MLSVFEQGGVVTNSIQYWVVILAITFTQSLAFAGAKPAVSAEQQKRALEASREEQKHQCGSGMYGKTKEECASWEQKLDNKEAELAKANAKPPESSPAANSADQPNSGSPAAEAPKQASQPSSSSDSSGAAANNGSQVKVDADGNRTQIHPDGEGGYTAVTKYKDGGGKVEKVNAEGEITDAEMALPGQDQSKLNAAAEKHGVPPPEKMPAPSDNKAQASTDAKPGADPKPEASANSEAQGQFDKEKSDIDQAAKGDATSEKAVDAKAPVEPDANAKARMNKANAEGKTFEQELTQLETLLTSAQAQAAKEATASCNSEYVEPVLQAECMSQARIQTAINCVNAATAQIKAAHAKLTPERASCTSSAAQADQLCSLVRSPKAQLVQQVMSAGAAALSAVTAATESCDKTSKLAKVAQGGMLLAQMGCTAVKVRCDLSCQSATVSMQALRKASAAIQKCQINLLQATKFSGPQITQAAGQLSARIEKELTTGATVPDAVKQCDGHSADILTMATQVTGFATASADAIKCKEQLAAGGAAGKNTSAFAGPKMTTAEYCSNPSNATSSVCKCTANPNADGCIGSVAKQGLQVGRLNSGSGASSFAGGSYGNGVSGLNASQTNKSDISKDGSSGSGLSAAAREALGLNNGGAATSENAAGGSNGVSSNAASAESAKSVEETKKRFGFFSSLGNLMGGGSGGRRGAETTASKLFKEKELQEAMKRKIASDEARAQISPASGMSNFEKISKKYKSKFPTLEE